MNNDDKLIEEVARIYRERSVLDVTKAKEIIKLVRDSNAKKAELWDYYQDFVRGNGAESITDLVVQRDDLKKLVRESEWISIVRGISDNNCPLMDTQLLEIEQLSKALTLMARKARAED